MRFAIDLVLVEQKERENSEGRSETDAEWGMKEYSGVDKKGKALCSTKEQNNGEGKERS
jgi:hypothetical protein